MSVQMLRKDYAYKHIKIVDIIKGHDNYTVRFFILHDDGKESPQYMYLHSSPTANCQLKGVSFMCYILKECKTIEKFKAVIKEAFIAVYPESPFNDYSVYISQLLHFDLKQNLYKEFFVPLLGDAYAVANYTSSNSSLMCIGIYDCRKLKDVKDI
jgi:hypothetical protein